MTSGPRLSFRKVLPINVLLLINLVILLNIPHWSVAVIGEGLLFLIASLVLTRLWHKGFRGNQFSENVQHRMETASSVLLYATVTFCTVGSVNLIFNILKGFGFFKEFGILDGILLVLGVFVLILLVYASWKEQCHKQTLIAIAIGVLLSIVILSIYYGYYFATLS